jgi:beta-ketoacyl-acyl-carrier-protein synthase II
MSMRASGQRRSVVVTGLGAVSPLGIGVPDTWAALLAGRSGIAPLTLFDPAPFAVQIAGEVKGFRAPPFVAPKVARHLDRGVLFALTAAAEALADAGLTIEADNRERIGCVCGTAMGGIATLLAGQRTLDERGPDRVGPFVMPHFLPNTAAGQIAITFGASGHNVAVVSACASGGHALGEAAEAIRRGDADAMIAGATEACLVPIVLAAFINMRALAPGDDGAPERASKPFDARRQGFVLAEGAAMLVLEDAAFARARGARIYAELAGYGSSNDAFHLAAPRESGDGPVLAMRRAMRSAGVEPCEVDYVNAHGTGTPLNDRLETAAIKRVFGEHSGDLVVSSTKSMTGHMGGAAGALEAMVSVRSIVDCAIPPTINLDVPDPDCDLDYAPVVARRRRVDVAMSNSFGLGGHNSCVLLRRYANA